MKNTTPGGNLYLLMEEVLNRDDSKFRTIGVLSGPGYRPRGYHAPGSLT